MLLKQLSELHGVSGNEKIVREFILNQIETAVDSYRVDRIGNLIANKKSSQKAAHRVAICAHMDEIGVFITDITPEGYLKFKTIGGMEPGILISKPLVINGEVQGVIGLKAIHLQKAEERKKALTFDDLYIDIGASTKEEAESVVKIGSYGTFFTNFESIGSERFKGKALDDRVGCAVLIRTLEDDYPCELDAVFTVQEELGLRGSKVISHNLQADLAIIIEATKAGDILESHQEDWVVQLGKGPACSLMDSTTIYKPELIQQVREIAKEGGIPLQYRKGTAAGNDAGNIHQAGAGIPTITLSIPCRYIHSMSSVISESDYEACCRLLKAILKQVDRFMIK